MSTSFTVLGAGTWGSVMAAHLHDAGHRVTLWHFLEDEAKTFERTRRHPFLEGFTLPEGLAVTADLPKAIAAGEIVMVALPSQVVRQVMEQLAPIIGEREVANLSKGIEQGSLKRMSEVIMEVAGVPPSRVASVYGPSHAEEVLQKIPTTLVAASENMDYARKLQKYLSTERLRVYTNPDIIGVELGGSVKNVIAIAAGICIGIGFGDNTMAALVTRGLAEITRLGLALGADRQTFAGLSGIGDLVVTAFSRHSRNRRLGVELGEGRKFKEIMADMGMVAEGVFTAQSVSDLARKLQVDMPICHQVHAVLFQDKDPHRAITDLMTRGLRDETIT
ncbi:MAG: NAD(P)-dependent glycerol-3-phosphate dehydrogenase [Candidatus Marinimicrobia bacterium]|nr:NAD(P)-dependent glycerol-3-phosphate dehydrogenase [Candidatus Neomarinimicrobiota bacterium]